MEFTIDDLVDIEDALTNLIQDKVDYCAAEEGTDEQIERLEALRAKVSAMVHHNMTPA